MTAETTKKLVKDMLAKFRKSMLNWQTRRPFFQRSSMPGRFRKYNHHSTRTAMMTFSFVTRGLQNVRVWFGAATRGSESLLEFLVLEPLTPALRYGMSVVVCQNVLVLIGRDRGSVLPGRG